MTRWFVVNLIHPRLSWTVEAKDPLYAVAIANHAPVNAAAKHVAKLEGSYTLAVATWAVWPVDQLGTYPLLVRERCE